MIEIGPQPPLFLTPPSLTETPTRIQHSCLNDQRTKVSFPSHITKLHKRNTMSSIPPLLTGPATAVHDSAQSAVVSFHTSQALEAVSGCHTENREAIMSLLSLCASSDGRVMAESERTVVAMQRAFEVVMQKFQTVAQENTTLRIQVVESNSKLNQSAQAHQDRYQACKIQMKMAKDRETVMQRRLDKTVQECNEKTAAAIRGKDEVAQTLADAHQEHITALKRSHEQAIIALQNQLDQAKSEHQTAIKHLSEKVSTTETQLQSASQAYAQLGAYIHSLNQANAQHVATIHSLNQTNAQHVATIHRLTQTNADITYSLQHLESQLFS